MHAEEKLTAFKELESAIAGQGGMAFSEKVCFASVPGCTTKVLYTTVGGADKFVSDSVTRQSNASSAGVKKGGVRTYAGAAALRDRQNPPGASRQLE